MLSRLEGPTTDFAANGLPELTSTIASLRQTSETLNTLLQDIQRSPTGVLAKPPAQQVKVKP